VHRVPFARTGPTRNKNDARNSGLSRNHCAEPLDSIATVGGYKIATQVGTHVE